MLYVIKLYTHIWKLNTNKLNVYKTDLLQLIEKQLSYDEFMNPKHKEA